MNGCIRHSKPKIVYVNDELYCIDCYWEHERARAKELKDGMAKKPVALAIVGDPQATAGADTDFVRELRAVIVKTGAFPAAIDEISEA